MSEEQYLEMVVKRITGLPDADRAVFEPIFDEFMDDYMAGELRMSDLCTAMECLMDLGTRTGVTAADFWGRYPEGVARSVRIGAVRVMVCQCRYGAPICGVLALAQLDLAARDGFAPIGNA